MTSSLRPTIACIYDFDGTLIPGNMQEYGFINTVAKSKKAFWQQVKNFATAHDLDDEVLAYMYLMIEAATKHKISIKRENFEAMGAAIRFFPGLDQWFTRLENKWGSAFCIDHYVISSGLEEIIEGCAIRKHFKKVYACRFIYDTNYGYPIWPGRVVNFTNKTQYLFRINKATDSIEDLNKYCAEDHRAVPFRQMIYFGDGLTDIPCMSLVKQGKGHVLALYPPPPLLRPKKLDQQARELVRDGRADIALPADYSKDSLLSLSVDKILALLEAELNLSAHIDSQALST